MNNLALALGTFDGLHKGHKQVLNEVKKLKNASLTPAALIFDKHPQEVLSGKGPSCLLTAEERLNLLEEDGVLPVRVSFEQICGFSPEEFVLFLKEMGAKAVACGENFHFGKNSSGDAKILFELCQKYGIIFRVAKSQYFGGELISSTRIRKALQNGEIEKAAEMLGRPFSYEFPVRHGKGKGKAWGFPTANQSIPENFIHLRYGVYASRVTVQGKMFPAVTNFGVRPTAHENGETVSETFVLGYDGDLYGDTLRVELISFIRDERKFESIDALSEQIKSDSKKAVEIFGCSK